MCLEDTSREALFDTIGDGKTSVGVLSTEGTNFFGGTVSKLFAPLNAIWSGDPQHINRVSKPPVSLTGKERLTAFIMIQPESLDAFIKKHGNEAMNSGFLPRFLVCDPPSKLGYRPPNTGPVESRALTRFHAIVAGLLDSPVGPRRTIALSGSARQSLEEFAIYCEEGCRPGGVYSTIPAAAVKAPEQATRLAGLLHLLEAPTETDPIFGQTMDNAIKLSSWFLNEFKRLFGQDRTALQRIQDAQELLAFLWQHVPSNPYQYDFKRNWVSQSGPNALRGDKVRRECALELLRWNGYIVCYKVGRTNMVKLLWPNPPPSTTSTGLNTDV